VKFFRALVLLSGFNDPRTRDVMVQMLGDPNDRLRSVAYTWFEHDQDKTEKTHRGLHENHPRRSNLAGATVTTQEW